MRLERAGVAEPERVGVTGVRQKRATLGGWRAAVLQFSLPMPGSSGTVTVPEVQSYLALCGHRVHILTLFGSSPSLATIAESVRFS